MANIFVASDHHFGHGNILTFDTAEGNKLRDFDNVDEMNETIIERHNSVVKPSDKIYLLGDFCFTFKWLSSIAPRLNGDKVLIKGNHDVLKLSQYTQYFRDIRAYHVMDKILLAHIPVHPESLGRWKGQIHGHLHSNTVQEPVHEYGNVVCMRDDPRYMNVCMEKINYTPLPFEECRDYFNKLVQE
jgi:calcineurin-like phosphoesterase family protein